MTDEQKKFKAMILADLKLALVGGGSDDKYERLLGAYHVQQAIEKTIKLKAGIQGLNLWGHKIAERLGMRELRKRKRFPLPFLLKHKQYPEGKCGA